MKKFRDEPKWANSWGRHEKSPIEEGPNVKSPKLKNRA